MRTVLILLLCVVLLVSSSGCVSFMLSYGPPDPEAGSHWSWSGADLLPRRVPNRRIPYPARGTEAYFQAVGGGYAMDWFMVLSILFLPAGIATLIWDYWYLHSPNGYARDYARFHGRRRAPPRRP